MSSQAEKSQIDIEWENRTLCSDESCIGVIGPDGHCKECGKPYDGEWKPSPKMTESFEESDFEEADEVEEDALDREDDEWKSRTLCSDESCIGVIGPDGRCKECGKPFSGGTNE